MDLPGVLAPARASCVCLLGTLTLQGLAELAFQLVSGIFRLRRCVGHPGLLPWERYT
jgi:hypothetical protein